jgi:LytS/YehU family sensor histidine kinase
MKTDKPACTLINDTYNKNWLKVDFFILSILIINIALHLFLFRVYKLMFPENTRGSVNSLILWIVTIIPFLFALLFISWRSKATRKQKRQKSAIEKTILQLETKALRAQMNPHFIFNCMNSIKAIIQNNEQEKAVNYLTAFSKLIRTIFQNSDKKEISLYDEIETCKLYAQLENMRLGNKFCCRFIINEDIDLKSIMVPALILQPFIENAIWHGIMPGKNTGMITVSIQKKNKIIQCVIDDDGIGRIISLKNKFRNGDVAHESRGVHLTQTRLNLDNVLNERHATIKIIDKINGENEYAGTKVIIVFKEE